jgi:hypothetical protein
MSIFESAVYHCQRPLTIQKEIKLDFNIAGTIHQSLVEGVRLGGDMGRVSFSRKVLFRRDHRVHQSVRNAFRIPVLPHRPYLPFSCVQRCEPPDSFSILARGLGPVSTNVVPERP